MRLRNSLLMMLAIATVMLFADQTTVAQIPTGAELWLDASSLSGSAGDEVATWSDLSGNGRDATAGEAAPTIGNWPNGGLKTVTFSGGLESLITTGYAMPTDRPYHIYIVEEYLSTGDPGADGSWFSTANPGSGCCGDLLRPVSTSEGGMRVFTGGGFPKGMYSTVDGMHPDGPGIVEAINLAVMGTPGAFSAFATHRTGQQFVRNQVPFSMNYDNDNAISNASRDDAPEHDLYLGKPGEYGKSLVGSMAEIIIYSRGLTQIESTQVQDYLTNKWILPEPTTCVLLSLGMVAMVGSGRRSGRGRRTLA